MGGRGRSSPARVTTAGHGPDRQVHPFRCGKNNSFSSLRPFLKRLVSSEALRSPGITDGSRPVGAAR